MGRVIELARWREDRGRETLGHDDVWRLEAAVRRLEPLVRAAGQGPLERDIETEILAITGAVTMGKTEHAATRAERLASLLEREAAGGS